MQKWWDLGKDSCYPKSVFSDFFGYSISNWTRAHAYFLKHIPPCWLFLHVLVKQKTATFCLFGQHFSPEREIYISQTSRHMAFSLYQIFPSKNITVAICGFRFLLNLKHIICQACQSGIVYEIQNLGRLGRWLVVCWHSTRINLPPIMSSVF